MELRYTIKRVKLLRKKYIITQKRRKITHKKQSQNATYPKNGVRVHHKQCKILQQNRNTVTPRYIALPGSQAKSAI